MIQWRPCIVWVVTLHSFLLFIFFSTSLRLLFSPRSILPPFLNLRLILSLVFLFFLFLFLLTVCWMFLRSPFFSLLLHCFILSLSISFSLITSFLFLLYYVSLLPSITNTYLFFSFYFHPSSLYSLFIVLFFSLFFLTPLTLFPPSLPESIWGWFP